jgi:TetR/AcrR family tetracycline transcriptional repressor
MNTSSEPARPMRPTLSRKFILQTALRIVDREGPNKLTMRHLGAELGVDPMAVYHYLPNKTALFDGITEAIWTSLDLDGIDPAGTWQQQLAAAMHALRGTLHAHPRAIAILGTRPIASPELFTLLDRMLGILIDAGMPANGDTADLLNTLVTYTIGHVLAEVGEPIGGQSAPPTYQTLTPQTHPNLAAVLNNGWTSDPDSQYERGLNALLNGWR